MPEQRLILDEPERPAPPKAPRPRRRRQVIMGVVMFLLWGIIGGYWVLTDPERVGAIAQKYLSEEIGGHVRIERARLSLFEGIRLDNVTISVDEKGGPDSLLFEAKTLLVKASVRTLLRGDLQATQIMAMGPQVHLCENVDGGEDGKRWNFQRLVRRRRPPPARPVKESKPMALPEVVLRGGVVSYSRIVKGKWEEAGSMYLDGQLMPGAAVLVDPTVSNQYWFDLEGRAPGKPSGPRLRGLLDSKHSVVNTSLENLVLDDAIVRMLPADVRRWCEAHRVGGEATIPTFRYRYSSKEQKADFHIEVELKNARFTALPGELMPKEEAKRLPSDAPPVVFHGAAGRFVFTPEKIELKDVRCQIEGNALALEGELRGYDPKACGYVRLRGRNLVIPVSPGYLLSLPAEVRHQYGKYRPSGRGAIDLELRRNTPEEDLEVTMDLEIREGQFRYDEFAYPLREVQGRIRFHHGRDGVDRVELHEVRGRGLPGTPNEDSVVHVNGWISPLNRSSVVEINVHGDSIHLDRPVREALPHDAKDVLLLFDQHVATAQGPRVRPAEMRGAFSAHVYRNPAAGIRKVMVDVMLDIQQASGAFREFPYPLQNLSGTVTIRPGCVEMTDISARQPNGAMVNLEGDVRFGAGRPVTPDLRIEARDVPVDSALLNAMPGESRHWIEKLSLEGKLDVRGRIFLSPEDPAAMARLAMQAATQPAQRRPATRPVDFDLAVNLNEGRLWKTTAGPAVTAASARGRLSRTRLLLHEAQGRRGEGVLTAKGKFAWPKDRPEFRVEVNGRGLAADPVLRELVGDEGRRWWDELRPEGKLDATVTYNGGVGEERAEARTTNAEKTAAQAVPAKAPANGTTGTYAVTIRPREMKVRPVRFPWAMEKVTGTLRIAPGLTRLEEICAWHGTQKLTLAGERAEGRPWELKLTGRDVVLDDELMAAVPKGISSFFRSIKLKGTFSFATSKLNWGDEEIEFQTRVEVANAELDAGVELQSIRGMTDIGMRVRDGDVYWMDQAVAMSSVEWSGRTLTNLSCRIRKDPEVRGQRDAEFRIVDLGAKLGDGRMYGSAEVRVPRDDRHSRYEMKLILRDIGLDALMGEAEGASRGRLREGSLYIQGNWDEPTSRRGTGSIDIEGRELYRVPVVFGWVQVAAMAMPTNGPFNRATAKYSFDGYRNTQKVVLEQVELRTPNSLMKGEGAINFADRSVKMVFYIGNSLLGSLGKELLQIHVTGSIQEPQVTGKAMPVFTTTVDKVMTARKPGKQGGK